MFNLIYINNIIFIAICLYIQDLHETFQTTLSNFISMENIQIPTVFIIMR